VQGIVNDDEQMPTRYLGLVEKEQTGRMAPIQPRENHGYFKIGVIFSSHVERHSSFSDPVPISKTCS
jgi:hypothetical protein